MSQIGQPIWQRCIITPWQRRCMLAPRGGVVPTGFGRRRLSRGSSFRGGHAQGRFRGTSWCAQLIGIRELNADCCCHCREQKQKEYGSTRTPPHVAHAALGNATMHAIRVNPTMTTHILRSGSKHNCTGRLFGVFSLSHLRRLAKQSKTVPDG